MRTEELLDGTEPGLPKAIWKLTPVGMVPVCPLAVMTLYAVTWGHVDTHSTVLRHHAQNTGRKSVQRASQDIMRPVILP